MVRKSRETELFREEERLEHARILKSLAEGRDPYTGIRLPTGIIGQPEIRRAILAGAAALMDSEADTRAGKPWRTEEKERLRDLLAMGLSNAEAAKRLRRSERAVAYKAEELLERNMHLPSEEERKAAMQSIRLRPGKEK